MSLGGGGDAEQEKEREKQKEKEEERKRQEEEEKRTRELESLRQLDKTLLDQFSDELLRGCIKLVSSVAESVYRVCDLIAALAKRNGTEWRNRTLDTIKTQVRDHCQHYHWKLHVSKGGDITLCSFFVPPRRCIL